jgi:hypothetical protein
MILQHILIGASQTRGYFAHSLLYAYEPLSDKGRETARTKRIYAPNYVVATKKEEKEKEEKEKEEKEKEEKEKEKKEKK